MHIQAATKADAPDLARLINLAGEGIPEYLWAAMREGKENPLEVGARRAAREDGGFSYRNARVIRRGGHVAGMIIAYRLDDPYDIGNLDDCPEVVRPLIELEARVPGSWYVNAIATDTAYRGQGIAKRLLQEAEARAEENGVSRMSLIVASENLIAKTLYLGLGYDRLASRPVIDCPGALHGGDWELLIKRLEDRAA